MGGNWVRLRARLVTGRTYLPESQAIFAAFTTPPTTARMAAIDTFVRSLIAAGVWTNLDTLYVTAAADSQASRINWVAPSTFALVSIGTPTFTADQGWVSAAASYLTTGFNTETQAGRKLLPADHSFFVGSLTNTNATNASFFAAGAARVGIQPRNNAGGMTTRSASGTGNAGTAGENIGKGFFGIRRNNSATYVRDRNGAVHSTVTQAVASMSGVCLVCTADGTNLSNKVLPILAFGRYIDDTAAAAFYTAYATYMNTIGTTPI